MTKNRGIEAGFRTHTLYGGDVHCLGIKSRVLRYLSEAVPFHVLLAVGRLSDIDL